MVAVSPRQHPFRTQDERLADRDAKREAVLLAAVKLFNARGFHATSLEDVAASLGVSKPVIYHYLGNKDQVLLECVRRGMTQLQEALVEARAHPGNGLDRLRAYLRRYAEINMADFGRCVVRTGPESLSHESAEAFVALKRDIDSATRKLVSEAGEDGSARVDDVRLTTFALCGALNWPARWFDPQGDLSAAETAEHLVDVLTAGLAPRGT